MTHSSSPDLIQTPFGFDSTAREVIDGIDLTGRRAIVTGAASGIGVETARALAGAGAHVTLAVRNTAAGERTAADISAASGAAGAAPGRVDVAELDLADLRSVRAFVAGWSGPLHLLINNAGVMAIPELQLSPEGWEQQLATNHLGHFALALGLHDALAAASGARIVSLSSVGHLHSPVELDDLDFHRRAYDPMIAYGQSKTANVLFAVQVTRLWADDGIFANAVHPGAIATTNLSRFMDPELLQRARSSGRYRFKTPEQGAATSVLVATSPQLERIGGRYFEHGNEAAVVDGDEGYAQGYGVAPFALDPGMAAGLWERSLAAAGGEGTFP
jgi:NAD(P)-dependent dehydrogenase (short-subunit alcohol dehydrogenase family)